MTDWLYHSKGKMSGHIRYSKITNDILKERIEVVPLVVENMTISFLVACEIDLLKHL